MPGGWWMTEAWSVSPVYLVSWVVMVVVSIVIHELAHGFVSIRCGDDVPIRSGHMTINPFVHIPPMAWIMFLLLGMTWGLMPVNPHAYRRRYDEALVAFAGPASNVLQAIVLAFAGVLWVRFGSGVINQEFYNNVSIFLSVGVMVNVVGALFNMLPVPPLDGSRILGNFVPAYERLWQREGAQVAIIILSVLLLTLGGRVIWPIGAEVSGWMVETIARLLAPVIGAPPATP